MGSGLARRAYTVAADKKLGHAAARLLVWMALNVRDESDPPLYFGGSDHRAQGLAVTDDSAVRRLVRELKTAGAITERNRGHRGRTSEYELNFRPVDNSTKEGQDDSPMGEKGGAKLHTKGGQDAPPYPLRDTRVRAKRNARPLASCGHPAIPDVDRYCERGCLLEVSA